MNEILTDVESVATGGLGIQTKLIIGVAVISLASVGALWVANHFEDKGKQLERAVWLQKQVAWDAAKAKLVTENDAKIQQTIADNAAKERKTSEAHNKEVLQLQTVAAAARHAADLAGGLRIPASACTGPSTTGATTEAPGTSGRDDTGTGTVALPQQTQNDLWSIVNEADLVSAQLRACQGWIKLNGFYGEAQAK